MRFLRELRAAQQTARRTAAHAAQAPEHVARMSAERDTARRQFLELGIPAARVDTLLDDYAAATADNPVGPNWPYFRAMVARIVRTHGPDALP